MSQVTTERVAVTIRYSGRGARIDASAGWSLLPFMGLGSGGVASERPLFLYADLTKNGVRHQRRAVVSSPYKRVRDLSTGGRELFNLVEDPEERIDLSGRQPHERDALDDLLDSWTAPH